MHMPTLRLASSLLLCLATPAVADLSEALDAHILPGYSTFTQATEALSAAADTDCTALRPAFNATFDAWLGVAHLRLGPAETKGRALAIAFWPDPKGIGTRQQNAMIAAEDPTALDPATFAEASVATRGLFALERLLYPEEPLQGDYPCILIRATAQDLMHMARDIEADWQANFATAILTAGQPGNTVFLSETEARQALFTQLITGIEFVKDARVGRPLGTFDKPRPERAESQRSGRTQRNIVLSLTSLRGYAVALDPNATETRAAFDRAIAAAKALSDPTLSDITDPQAWLKLDILRQSIQVVQDAAIAEIGTSLNVSVGFNAADGD
jgi:uncharacterized protein